ncbi:MAG: hypothetical protein WAM88_12485 [Nitrososphaeraceae archaeon]
MTESEIPSSIPNLDPSRKKINVIARLESFVNNPNIKAISMANFITYIWVYSVIFCIIRNNGSDISQ